MMQREIFNEKDLESFKKSDCCANIVKFIQLTSDSIQGQTITNEDNQYSTRQPLQCIVEYMKTLEDYVDQFPPLNQPMRFGNKAFRLWHANCVVETPKFVRSLLQYGICDDRLHEFYNKKDIDVTDTLVNELSSYICCSFGNETRIDYGTGHELNIVLFYLCLYKLGIISQLDFSAIVLKCFSAYIRTMRKLLTVYLLEPAGSHGVWGLDDYHCLTFLWGSAQLWDHPDIFPNSINDDKILKTYKHDYLYLECISFVKQIKSGASFSETSPMLSDISELGDWKRVTAGLFRLFQGEVLFKFPVVQHVLFGIILVCDWKHIESQQHSHISSIHNSSK